MIRFLVLIGIIIFACYKLGKHLLFGWATPSERSFSSQRDSKSAPSSKTQKNSPAKPVGEYIDFEEVE